MNGAEHRIAVLDRLHDNAHGNQVIDFGEPFAALRHLLVDGVQMLRTPRNVASNIDFGELARKRFYDVGKVALALYAAFRHHAADLAEFRRIEIVERKVFELPLDGADTKAMGYGSVNFKRFARLEDAAILLERRKRTHVMQAVGKLDDDDANVFAHGDEHLTNGCRLLIGQAPHLDARDLCDALHQLSDLRVKQLGHFFDRRRRIFHRVVKKSRTQRVGVHTQIGKNERHFYGVSNKRLTAFALLLLVSLTRKTIRFLKQSLIVFVDVLRRNSLKLRKTHFGSPCLGRLRGRGYAALVYLEGPRSRSPGENRIDRSTDLRSVFLIGHRVHLPLACHRAGWVE